MPILSSVLVLIGFFLISCVGINLYTWKTLYALASLKYCYIAQAALLIAARAVLFVI